MRLKTSSSFFASLRHAVDGWSLVLASQRNMQIHLAVALALSALCVPLHLQALETALLLLCVGLVFAAELGNSALEACVDLYSPQRHPLAKRAKDAAAAAVLVLALVAVALFFVLFARQWPLLYATWPTWVAPIVLLGSSAGLWGVQWVWLGGGRLALVCRGAALVLWLGCWPYVVNGVFWGLGLCLLALSGGPKKAREGG